jgi:hypothetical protein
MNDAGGGSLALVSKRVLRSVYLPRGRPVEIAVSWELGVSQ